MVKLYSVRLGSAGEWFVVSSLPEESGRHETYADGRKEAARRNLALAEERGVDGQPMPHTIGMTIGEYYRKYAGL